MKTLYFGDINKYIALKDDSNDTFFCHDFITAEKVRDLNLSKGIECVIQSLL